MKNAHRGFDREVTTRCPESHDFWPLCASFYYRDYDFLNQEIIAKKMRPNKGKKNARETETATMAIQPVFLFNG